MLESQAGKAYSKARLKVLQTWKYPSLISMTASRQVAGGWKFTSTIPLSPPVIMYSPSRETRIH